MSGTSHLRTDHTELEPRREKQIRQEILSGKTLRSKQSRTSRENEGEQD